MGGHQICLPCRTYYWPRLLSQASWIGWTLSPSAANQVKLDSVFSWSFVVLLLDVLLVVFYFILVRGVEVSHNGDGTVTQASAYHEAFWVVCIFVGYLVWDIVTKLLMKGPTDSRGNMYWTRGRLTIASLVLAVAIWWIGRDVSQNLSVVAVDMSLLLAVLAFRAMKEDKWAWTAGLVGGAVASLVVGHLVG